MDKAVRLNDKARVAALANTTVVKAKKLEAADAAARAKSWREALTRQQPGSSCSGHGSRLSRLAFRWVTGVAGWTSGTLDVEGYDDAVPECPPGGKLEADGDAPIPKPTGKQAAQNGPASDQAQFEATARVWAKLWKAESAYQQPDLAEADEETLRPLTGPDIKACRQLLPRRHWRWRRRNLAAGHCKATRSDAG